ncbi:molybdopterin synthase catalytic subunit MoaE [Thaumasiovibrio subtropicus]|uniref:molybdopterin synthase catalytic subunit MoaE n=1 Tax=Thaumasiovibrio subtropicus TaxID=1891207 RepID=UPI000B35B205|nr:molybdopterin synthase catalytic subunit MoaE [Thaumasiovibrio subtropicus]
MICVQVEDFDVGKLYDKLCRSSDVGGVVTFVGRVRDFNQGHDVTGLYLEHYPGMTESALEEIAHQAKARWPLSELIIVHRVGELSLTEQIVFVGASSAHREAAFSACQFVMDFLKNRAPFWKKECTTTGQRWVEAEQKDADALKRW